MHIRMAVQCHNFQQRFCWQLSSILEQEPFEARLSIEVACMPLNGNPSTEYVCDFFRGRGLDVEEYYYPKEIFAKRGLVRNEQIQHAKDIGCDWIFYVDADHIYHPDYFKELVNALKKSKADNCHFSSYKEYAETESSNQHARLAAMCPYIVDAYRRADNEMPKLNKRSRAIAYGGCQICRIDDIERKNNGIYIEPDQCRDKHLFRKGQRARSDIQFRRRMGGGTQLHLPKVIEMSHVRDKEVGYHVTDQR